MSPLQYRIYQFIKSFLAEHGYSPTLLEIAKGVGISPRSKGLVSRYVHELVKSGRLAFDRKGYRNIYLPPFSKLQLPVVGEIAAGSPIEPTKEHEILDLNAILGEEECYILVVKGDSLSNDGILNGDKIICKRQPTAKEGALVLAMLDKQRATIKRIHYLDNEMVELKTANPSIKPSTYAKEQVTIQAIVIGILRIIN